MLKKTVTYVDFLGTTRTEDLYFHLSKQELSDMQMSVDGGYNNLLDKMIKAADNKAVYKTFVEIVLAAYGELSPDGKYHLKKDAEGHRLADMWKQSASYDALMDEICKDESTIAEFCNGIMPEAVKEKKVEPQDHQMKQFRRPEDR